MKLNLKQALELVEIKRPKFDSARVRGLYSFMYEAYEGDSAAAEYENARNRFGLEHVVGLACVDYGTDTLGLSFQMADSIVGNNFGELAQAVRDGAIDPDDSELTATKSPINHFFIGSVFNVVGRAHHAGTFAWFHDAILREVLKGDENGVHSDHRLLGVHMIDATTVCSLVKTRMLKGLGI